MSTSVCFAAREVLQAQLSVETTSEVALHALKRHKSFESGVAHCHQEKARLAKARHLCKSHFYVIYSELEHMSQDCSQLLLNLSLYYPQNWGLQTGVWHTFLANLYPALAADCNKYIQQIKSAPFQSHGVAFALFISKRSTGQSNSEFKLSFFLLSNCQTTCSPALMLPCVLEQFFCVQYAWCLSPIIIPGDETAHRNHGEYVTANSRKHLDAPSKSISF